MEGRLREHDLMLESDSPAELRRLKEGGVAEPHVALKRRYRELGDALESHVTKVGVVVESRIVERGVAAEANALERGIFQEGCLVELDRWQRATAIGRRLGCRDDLLEQAA
jgi:hypothetical protein